LGSNHNGFMFVLVNIHIAGSHLVEALAAHGAEVKPFVYYNSFNSWGWLDPCQGAGFADGSFAGDIRATRTACAEAMKGCDAVFHLAALIAIPFSVPLSGRLRGHQCQRHVERPPGRPAPRGSQKLIVTSTSEVYGTAKYVPINESHPFQGRVHTAPPKSAADRLAESFYRSFNLPVTIVRPFNAYGPRRSRQGVYSDHRQPSF